MDHARTTRDSNCGTVYKLSYSKKKGWTEKILYSFKGPPEDGRAPWGIVFDAAGNIYGNTGFGGKYKAGTIFELVPVGNGRYNEKVIWTFGKLKDGYLPRGSPTLDSAGNLYGTADGGWRGSGIVFEVTP
ncbi:MAG TPA: choice-of-anchor tandem repeat GloVer-containing protein [Terriglobales bacterium]|nr:choice-of-anchor tandem repeat GloVer-containing protein [Terriglobales bacterium]